MKSYIVLVVLVICVSVSIPASGQERQKALYIDDGNGNFLKLVVSSLGSGRTITFADPGGPASAILSTSSAGQTISGGLSLGTPLGASSGGTGASSLVDAITNMLPSQSGHTNQVLTTDGNGTLSWTNVGAAPFAVFAGSSGGTNVTAGSFIGAVGANLTSIESGGQMLVGRAGTLRNFYVRLAVTATTTYSFIVRVNGTNTSLAVTIPPGSSSGSDLIDSVSLLSFDLVSVQCTIKGTPSTPVATSFEIGY